MKKRLWKLASLTALPIIPITLSASDSSEEILFPNLHNQLNLSLLDFDNNNDAAFQPYAKYRYNDWMKYVNGNKTLFQMSIPGTHDSAAFQGTGFNWGVFWKKARTQAMSITRQLNMGIRAFDLRADYDLNMRHGITYLSDNLDSVMSQMKQFLAENPSEFVIFRIKDESMDVNNEWQAKTASQNYMNTLAKYKDYLYNPNGLPPDQLSWKLDDMRGKMVILNMWHHKVNLSLVGGTLYWALVGKDSTQQDQYENVTVDQKLRLIESMWDRSNMEKFDTTALYVNFMNIAGSLSASPISYAKRVDLPANEYLNLNNDLYKLGMTYMDFPGPALIQNVFRRNFYLTDAQLDAGYYNGWSHTNRINIANNLVVGTNLIQLESDNLADYTIEIQVNSADNPNEFTTIQTVKIPNERANTWNIKLNNFAFKENQKVKLLAYRWLPQNVFYEGRKFNTFEQEANTVLSKYVIEWRQLNSDIDNYLTNYQIDSDWKNFITQNFVNKLNDIQVESQNNWFILDDLKSAFNVLTNKRVEINNSKSQVETQVQNIGDLKFINPDVISSIKNFQENWHNFFNEILNNNSETVNQKYESLTVFLNNYQTLIEKLNEVNNQLATANTQVNDLKDSWTLNDYDFSFWINKINQLVTQNFKEFASDLASQLGGENFANIIDTVTSNVNAFMKQVEVLGDMTNEVKNTFTSPTLTKNFMNLFTVNIQEVLDKPTIRNLQILQQNVAQVIDNVEHIQSIIEGNNDFVNNYQLQKYNYGSLSSENKNFIEELNNSLTKQYSNLEEFLNNTNEIANNLNQNQNTITDIWDAKENLLNTINNSNVLFNEQKTALINKLNNIFENYSTQNNFDDLNSQVQQLININPVDKFNSLKWDVLNTASSQYYENKIKPVINVTAFTNWITYVTQLVNYVQALKDAFIEIKKFEDPQLKQVLTSEQFNQFTDFKNEINSLLNSELEKQDNILRTTEELKNWKQIIQLQILRYQYTQKISAIFNEFQTKKEFKDNTAEIQKQITNKTAEFKNTISNSDNEQTMIDAVNDYQKYLDSIKLIPAPEPTPEPAPEPTPEPAPEPTPEPAPEPTPEPAPEPTPEPAPEPTPEPAPEPTPEPAPEPTPEPAPEPTPEPAPEPTPEPAPEPTPEPAPEPTPEPAPEPTPEPAPEPTPEPAPEPTPEPAPEPTPEPAPEPTPEPDKEIPNNNNLKYILGGIFGGLSLIFISIAAYFGYKKFRKKK
ncbi:phosphatidylinositol-specific phospholipase C domain-containing protein [Mycoplasma hafezii]|uniref:phosphatidylinositol-specific phospholipase C domain-containing protein n=1 Tax=Mycoplasma hafezii TaxID=525886 RepID=UPI003CF4E4CA